MVAILGDTGAGKSTLINLVPRFYEITGGCILLDGVDIRKLSQDSLLATIAIVPQQTILFSGTVRDNIRYGSPAATEDEVIAAAKAAPRPTILSSSCRMVMRLMWKNVESTCPAAKNNGLLLPGLSSLNLEY